MGSIMGLFNKNKDIKDIKLSKKEEIALKAAFDDSHLRKGYDAPPKKKGNAISRMFINYDNPQERIQEKSKRTKDWFEEHKRKTRAGETKFGIDADVYDNITTQEDMFGKKKRPKNKVYKSGELIDMVNKQDWSTGRTEEQQAKKRYVDQGFRTDKEHKEDMMRIKMGKETGSTNLLTPLGQVVAAPAVIAAAAANSAAKIAKEGIKQYASATLEERPEIDTTMPMSARKPFIPRISMPSIQLPQIQSTPTESMSNLNQLGKFLGVL
jgi:hypothetical protein